jgi:hypothetical protein
VNDFRPTPRDRVRRLIWCAAVALIGAAFAFINVPTRLGVQVPETKVPGFDPSLVDLSRHETAWRIWWRAHDQFASVNPQWMLTAGLVILFAVFMSGILAAVWLALSPDPEPDTAPE